MNNQTFNKILLNKYLISVLIDILISVTLIIGFALLYNTISQSFNGLGTYLFWLYMFLIVIHHIFSDRLFKFQSYGKKIMGIIITSQVHKNAALKNIFTRRIVEILIFFKKDKEKYFYVINKLTKTEISIKK
ncbi:MAG: RDD family protein [Candidatus Izemoplasmatales bacterium]